MEKSDLDTLRKARWLRIQMIEYANANRYVKGVLRAVDSHMRDKLWSWPSYQTIGEHIGVSERTAMRHVKSCLEGGWLVMKSRAGRSNYYAINWRRVFQEMPADKQSIIRRRLKPKVKQPDFERRSPAPLPAESRSVASPRKSGRSGFPAGYSPHGQPAQTRPAQGGEYRRAPKIGRRWKGHIDSESLRDPGSLHQLFEQAADLGFVNRTEHARREVWAMAVGCRRADNPGAMFRLRIESADFSKTTDADEEKARREIKDYESEVGLFSAMLDEAFEGAI